MISRIRTIKPEFFKHEELYELGIESGHGPLLRLAFAGLWCQADRDGRFKWRPRLLRLEICPWDDVDFADVLGTLERGGFIARYDVDGKPYGWIPTFLAHQRPNQREARSCLPAPPESQLTLAVHVHARADMCMHVGKGTGTELEQKGRELELGSGSDVLLRRRASMEWDKSQDLMRRMKFDDDTVQRVERCRLDDLELYALLRDVFDNRRVKNKAAYAVGAIKKIES